MKRLPFISIVSLNWNSWNELSRLLKSIATSDYPKEKYEVIVVDNGSSDHSVEKIKTYFPETKIIALKTNLGIWARNYAFKKVKGEIIVTLDSDAVLPTKDTLKKVVERLLKDPKVGILGVKVINKKSKTPEFSPMKLNFYTGIISTLNAERQTFNATWVPFILSAIPKKVLKKVGLLYEAFAYGEDMNFCIRLKKAGFKVLYWPEVFVYHNHHKARPDVSFSIKYHHYYKSLFRNIWKYGNVLQKITLAAFQLFIIPPIYLVYYKKLPPLKARWWGFWWNFKRISFEEKVFISVLFVGTIIRIFGLTSKDFWFDEAFTYQIAKLPLRALFEALLTDNNPPLYYLVIHFVLRLGQSEVLLRIPSLMLNLSSVIALYLLVKNLFDKKIALIASSLYFSSPLAVYMSSEARPHSLGMFFATLITLLFFLLLKKGKKNLIVFFIIVSVLGLYTQYYVALLFLPFTFIILTQKTNISFRKWVSFSSLGILAFSPWIILSIKSAHNNCSCPNTILSFPASIVSPSIGGVGEVSLRYFLQLPSYLYIFLSFIAISTVIFFLLGVFKSGKFAAVYLIPLLIISLIGFFNPAFSPKAFAIFSPLYFIFVGLGLNSLKRKSLFAAATLGLILVSTLQILNPFFKGQNFDLLVENLKNDSEATIAHTSVYTYYSLNFYLPSQKHILLTENILLPGTVKFIGGQKTKLDSERKIWLVETNNWVDDRSFQEAISHVNERFIMQKEYDVGIVSLQYLKRSD